MRRTWFGLLAASLLAAPPAAAQERVLVPEAPVLERMCSSAGTYQYAFGQTGVPGAGKPVRALSRGVPLPASAAPFSRGKPWSTEWSDRLFAMEYMAPMPEGGTLDEFAAALGSVLTAAGWAAKPADYDPPIYMLTASGDWTWTRPDPTAPDQAELVLGLSGALGEIVLTCGRTDLMLAHAEEALGNLPAGTPRPAMPDIPIPALRSEADCGQPAVIAEIERLLASNEPDLFLAQMVARTTYRDRLTSWMAWKLEQSGKVAPDRLAELLLSAAGSVSPDGNPFAQFEMFGEMLDLIEPIADAEGARDPAALCRSLVPFESWLARIDALTLGQTEAAQAALTAEAARLGVPLD